MNLIQFSEKTGDRAIAVIEDGVALKLKGYTSVYDLVLASMSSGGMAETVRKTGVSDSVDPRQLSGDGVHSRAVKLYKLGRRISARPN